MRRGTLVHVTETEAFRASWMEKNVKEAGGGGGENEWGKGKVGKGKVREEGEGGA